MVMMKVPIIFVILFVSTTNTSQNLKDKRKESFPHDSQISPNVPVEYYFPEFSWNQKSYSGLPVRTARSLRSRKIIDIEETKTDFLFSLSTGDYAERFEFKDPAPEVLELNPVMGSVRVKAGYRLDYETSREIEFTVIIRRVDLSSYLQEQPVTIRLLDVNDELPVFRNVPRPYLACVSSTAGPGTSVYQLMGEDLDRDSVLRYHLESGGEDRFSVDGVTGVVRTVGTEFFPPGKEFVLGVSVEDISVLGPALPGRAERGVQQKAPTEPLKILVGERDPQFFQEKYKASVSEASPKQYSVLEVKALSHRGLPITYELITEAGTQSNQFLIDRQTGLIELLKQLDYEQDPHQYRLKVKAIENSRQPSTSTVDLVVDLLDTNDNAPMFPLSQYIVHGVQETVPIGTNIIHVSATDLDSGENARLVYSVTDENFDIETYDNVGHIKTARRLDYDFVVGHTYNFTVVATDNGRPETLKGMASVRVSVTNANDEPPQFTEPIEYVQVSEEASANTVVHVVQAYDPDGDDVNYSFNGGLLVSGPFRIDPITGILTLTRPLDKSRAKYHLNVTATDNGRCCASSAYPQRRLTNHGQVIIEVKDINNNAPRFPRCTSYHPVAMEKENVGTFVVQVIAEDSDIGSNGNITYSLVKSTDHGVDRFNIDPISGVLTTADVFDREAKIGVTDYGVTVKAEDNGNPKLAGFCTFRVKIGDRNDNPPVFNLYEYQASIEESSPIGRRVKQVYATDRDAGDNSRVEYSIKSDSTNQGFFSINHHSGWVTVSRPLVGYNSIRLEIEAKDKGIPAKSSTVQMNIEITSTTNEYPQWIGADTMQPVQISENVQVNSEVVRLKATSSSRDALFNYIISNGDLPEQNGHPRSFYMRVDEMTNEMIILTYRPLDYESLPKYILTLKAANRAVNALHTDLRITIELQDENDEIPQFIGLDENGRYPGSVAENLPAGSEVITVTATDRDEFPAFRKVTYRIKDVGEDYNKFTIDPESGVIRTKMSFDREQKNEYYITVITQDGAPSTRINHQPPGTPNKGEAEVQIRVTDMNDNAPYFKERYYKARVPENTDIGTVVMIVTAEDNDEENGLTYSITGGNNGSVFEVVPDLGEIKVRGHLDYETGPREYVMTYRVFDDKYANTTTIVIEVVDVNDNAPVFDNDVYNVMDLVEEERGISKNNPKYLLTVRATDPDVNRPSRLRYGLTGQFAEDGTFIINEHTGEVYLTRPLDRDPPKGRAVWNFNVLAHDEVSSTQPSLTGYAEVRVQPKDVNDNSPAFDLTKLEGKISEHSRSGMPIMTVSAFDPDHGNNGSLSYKLSQIPMRNGNPLFTINSHTGLLSTMQNDGLDREIVDVHRIIVIATDHGIQPMSATATATIYVEDINDHRPVFTNRHYRATMSESLLPGSSVTSVSASDRDIGQNAKLHYSLSPKDREYFTITSVEATNAGVLKVYKQIDYDTLGNPFMNITVYVEDIDNTHTDQAFIEVSITDANDNAPIFNPPQQQVQIPEDVALDTSLFKFKANDSDTGINKNFTYSIDRSTDPDKLFSVDNEGLITTVKRLDRETRTDHRIHILAIDKGEPPLTGVGTLIVVLTDVNDNFPIFAENYRPIVFENEPPGQKIIEISAIDKDSPSNGPPFEFWLPCAGSCPCPANPHCSFFSFRFKPESNQQQPFPTANTICSNLTGGGTNGYGSAIITSLQTFDREQRREYYLPIIMRDSGTPPMSGTNTLTIIIGDVNDNPHFPGHKDIFVYNYKGQFEDVPLGNVYVDDKDDWDIPNKTFTFSSDSYNDHFRLIQDTGMLFTRGRTPSGEYNLKIKVYDKVWQKDVESTVHVILRDIEEKAVISSGSIRLQGTTAEEFVTANLDQSSSSKYQLLREFLARKLNVPKENVDIFTVRNHPKLERIIDVRYSAHGSPFYRPEKLDGLVQMNLDELDDFLGVKVLQSPVGDCAYTSESLCESGSGCSDILIIGDEPLMINSNSTSIIGVNAYTETKCICRARTFEGEMEKKEEKCSASSCYNGGICKVHENNGKTYCTCPPQFSGPRCQLTHRSFTGDGSWAWFPLLEQCMDSHTSLEIITMDTSNMLVLYFGPLHGKSKDDTSMSDYMFLELHDGFPLLRLNMGTGELRLMIDGKDNMGRVRQGKLNDGKWHRIDIIKEGNKVRLMVDRCMAANSLKMENSVYSNEDRRACEDSGNIPGDGKFLNIPHALQLGGRKLDYSADRATDFPAGISRKSFRGCIKNFIHNGELYDLGIDQSGFHNGTEDGCPREEKETCGSISSKSSTCGVNGNCIGSFHANDFKCICKSGWKGPKCDIETEERNFLKDSFLEWKFKEDFYTSVLQSSSHLSQISLMFRTRQASGLLIKAQSEQKSEYAILEVVSERLRFRYSLGGGVSQELILSHVNVSDGAWHWVSVERVGQWVSIMLDSGEGRGFNESLGIMSVGGRSRHAEMLVAREGLVAGGDVRFPADGSTPLVDLDFENSCMKDIRFNNQWLPMDSSDNLESSAAELTPRSQNTQHGCASDACVRKICAPDLVCVDLWRHAECRCPVGQKFIEGPYYGTLCRPVNECDETPGICHWGTCVDTSDGYTCRCEDGYTGSTCAVVKGQVAVAQVSHWAWLIIFLCALLLITILLLFLIYTCRKRRQKSDDLYAGDDVRENMIHYDEEGVGELDQNGYDISKLRKRMEPPPYGRMNGHPVEKSVFPSESDYQRRPPRRRQPHALDDDDVEDFINDRLYEADNDPTAPPHESVREYAYEGEGSTAGSLSSFGSQDDLDFDDPMADPYSLDYLNAWGPRFNNLAQMYQGEEL